jgi:hypothetical protein
MKSAIVGYYGSYQAAYNAVGERFKRNRKFSIQQACIDHRAQSWALIYYGNFV